MELERLDWWLQYQRFSYLYRSLWTSPQHVLSLSFFPKHGRNLRRGCSCLWEDLMSIKPPFISVSDSESDALDRNLWWSLCTPMYGGPGEVLGKGEEHAYELENTFSWNNSPGDCFVRIFNRHCGHIRGRGILRLEPSCVVPEDESYMQRSRAI